MFGVFLIYKYDLRYSQESTERLGLKDARYEPNDIRTGLGIRLCNF